MYNNKDVPAYIRLKLESNCSICKKQIKAGELAFWIAAKKETIHRDCGKPEWKGEGSNYATRKDLAIRLVKMKNEHTIKDILSTFRERYIVSYRELVERFKDRAMIVSALEHLLERKCIAIPCSEKFYMTDKALASYNFSLPSDYQYITFVITPVGNHYNLDADRIELPESWKA